jgi:hypothetical protein
VISGSTVGPEQCASSQSALAALAPSISMPISTDFVNANYGGSSLTWYVSNIYGCSGGRSYSASSMPSGWNDVISSYKDYLIASCTNNPHYENNDFKGAVVNCGPNCRYVGDAMNDRTSSEKWRA